MPPISVLVKPASGSCNMHCEYCFYCDEQEKRRIESFGMMSEETLDHIIRKFVRKAEGCLSIAFQGGEPTLRGLDYFKKAVALIKQYSAGKRLQVMYAFQTNGTTLTEEWCRFFSDNKVLVGVSLDGYWKTHNKYRHFKNGSDTFERVRESIALLKKYEVEFNILTVVHNETAAEIRRIYRCFRDQGFDFQQYIPCLDPIFEQQGSKKYSLTPEVYGKFLKELFDCWYEDRLNGHNVYIRQFDNFEGMVKGYPPESCDQRGICGIQYVVEADGSVYPCDFYVMDDYYLGNINEDSINAIDEKRRQISFVEESCQLPEQCKICEYVLFCRNGCRRNRVLQEDGTYLNYFCASIRTFFEYSLDRLKTL